MNRYIEDEWHIINFSKYTFKNILDFISHDRRGGDILIYRSGMFSGLFGIKINIIKS